MKAANMNKITSRLNRTFGQKAMAVMAIPVLMFSCDPGGKGTTTPSREYRLTIDYNYPAYGDGTRLCKGYASGYSTPSWRVDCSPTPRIGQDYWLAECVKATKSSVLSAKSYPC